MSIRGKVTVLFFIFIFIPFLFLGTLGYLKSQKALEAAIFLRLSNIADLKVKNIESYFKERVSNIQTIQSNHLIHSNLLLVSKFFKNPQEPSSQKAGKMLDHQLVPLKEIYNLNDVMLLNPEGVVVYVANKQDHGIELGKRLTGQDELIFSKTKNTATFSGIYEFLGKIQMLVAGPIHDDHGSLVGFIVFEVNVDSLYDFIQETTGLGETGETLIGKKMGHEVVFLNPLRHDSKAALNRKVTLGVSSAFPIQEAAQGRSGSGISVDYRGAKIVAAWRFIPLLDWGLVAKIDAAEAFAPIYKIRNFSIIIAIFTLLFVIIIFMIFRESITKPILDLHQAVQAIGEGDLNFRVGVKSKDEIGDFARAFNQMTDDLKKSYEKIDDEIRERKRVEQELRYANQMKSEFLSNMSHELRTPLNAIIGFSDLLKDPQLGSLNDQQKEFLDDIKESGEHLLLIINDVLDLSKVEAGKLEINLEQVDLKKLLLESLSLIKEKALKHDLKIVTDIDENCGIVLADKKRLKQIMYNLLSNAAKFTPDKGKIKILANRGKREVTVSIWDSGIGIDEKDRPMVFGKFEQIDSSYNRKYMGTGLGMPITKKLVELHGGRIWFSSSGKGKGTCFNFTIPLRD